VGEDDRTDVDEGVAQGLQTSQISDDDFDAACELSTLGGITHQRTNGVTVSYSHFNDVSTNTAGGTHREQPA